MIRVYATEVASHAAQAASHEGGALFFIGPLEVTSRVTTAWAIMAVLILVSYFATRNMKKVPTGAQNVMELILTLLRNFFDGILSPETRKYFPLFATMFLFIIFSNYSGLLPSAGHLPGLAAPTSALGTTVGLAVVIFCSTHGLGVKEKGLGYFKHFIQPIALLLPLMILEEFIRPLSLSLRLFGNIFGEESVAEQVFGLCPYLAVLPIQVLGLLFGLIQAIVFTMLAAIYIDGAVAHHDH